MAQDILVPDIGDFKDVEVIDVLVKVGDRIEVDTPLITIETEKATMDVPSTAAGLIQSIAINKGARVAKGNVILSIESAATAAEVAEKSSVAAAPAPVIAPSVTVASAPQAAASIPAPPSVTSVPDSSAAGFAKAHASPSVRRLARELGVDLARVNGSGVKARITPDDVKQWVKRTLAAGALAGGSGTSGLPKIAPVDFAKFGAVEVRPLGRIQKISGPRLHASWVNVPHVWQHDEADITELEATRQQLKTQALQRGVKLTPLAFIIKAVVNALQEFPTFNTSLDATGQNLVFKQYLHIGFAADTPNGLVVPVIRNADQKDVYEIAQTLAALSEKARIGKLSGADMQGGCFTVSSLGGIGGTAFTPIINAPEVAILGVAKASRRPVYNDKTSDFDARLMLPFTLAYDHRVVDGALGARFTTYLARQLADVKKLLQAEP